MTMLTPRLRLRRLTPADAPFIVTLLNDEGFLRYIGDKGVRTLDDARQYIEQGPMASYARDGFGLNLVELRDAATPIGICGVLRREGLDAPDLGFAFMPAYRRHGYAYEAAEAVLEQASTTHRVERVLAITNPENERSIALLERLGFRFERLMHLPNDRRAVRLFSREQPRPA